MTWELPTEGISQYLEGLNPSWLQPMRGCPQDPVHHAEGDVFTHFKMVCSELEKLPSYQNLPAEEKQVLAWAAALHDVAKPACTERLPEGRISSPGHAAKGAAQARRILWQAGCPFSLREQICGLVHYHMKVFWALENEHPERLVREISLRCRCSHLAILAEADARGRHCADLQNLLDNITLFSQLAQESNCYEQAYPFASEVARYRYLVGKWHNPDMAPYEDFKCEVVLMSGLPGSGKDTWISKSGPNWPVISLDALRSQLKISPTANQGRVLDAAREQARVHLRAGENFIWNATNISRLVRAKAISLFLEYGAKVKIVYLEQTPQTLERQNRERDAMVPWPAIQSLIGRWQPPTHREAHEVVYLAE